MRRILTIDGGGIKGVFPLAFLASIEEATGRPVAEHFDLLAGTSTGGIIALGLGLGFSARDLLAMYERLGHHVFAGIRLARLLRWFPASKYAQGPLKQHLNQAFEDKKLGDSSRRLLIPAVNLETGRPHIYKTAHHPRFEKDYRENAVTVALATSAAPSYLPVFRDPSGTLFVDGGLWANNPVALAVIEAIKILEWSSTDLQVLSLGCTEAPINPGLASRFPMGCIYWAFKGPQLMTSVQSAAALGMAALLAGSSNVVRISPTVAPSRFSLDNASGTESLRGLGYTEARAALPSLRSTFFSDLAEEFVPVRRP